MQNFRHVKFNGLLFLAIILLFISGPNQINAQEERKNNSINIAAGTLIFNNQFSIAYERSVYSRGYFHVRAKVHYGRSSVGLDLDEGGKKYKNHKGVSGVFLFQLFEFNLGLVFTQYTLASGDMPNPDIDYSLLRNGLSVYSGAGIRYEKNEFVVRAGFNNFEYLYAGVGICF